MEPIPTNDDRMDLEWFFNDSDGDLGMKSNHETVVALIQNGPGTCSSSAGAEQKLERTIDASDRYRRIGGALGRLSVTQQAALKDAFTRAQCPANLRHRPRQHVAAACASKAMRDFLRELGSQRWSQRGALEWLVRAEDPKKDSGVPVEVLTTLRVMVWREAEARVDDLVAAYMVEERAWREEAERVRIQKIRGAA